MKVSSTIFVAAAAGLLCSQSVESKSVYGKGYFGTESVHPVTKFSFKPGKSEVEGNITYTGAPRGSIYLFMDTNWQEHFHNEEDCEKVKHAHTKIPIGRTGLINKGLGKAHGSEPYQIPLTSNQFTWKFEWTITHAVRTYGWYFVIADCAGFKNGDEKDENTKSAVPVGKNKKKRRLKRNQFLYEMEIYNPGRDHMPADERGLTTLYTILTGAMGYYFYNSSKEYKRKTGNGLIYDSHAVIKAFAFAYSFQLLSMSLEVLHLFRYSMNGYGFVVFDFFSEFFEALSQMIISYTLLCLGSGWTLVNLSHKTTKMSSIRQMLNNPTLDDETPALFILVFVVFVSTILQIINKVTGDEFTKFHDYDGISGMFLLLQRLLLGFAFLYFVTGTIKMEEVRGQLQLEGFLGRLRFFGTIWLFAFPVNVLIANLFAHYLRHIVVTGGVLVVQSICLTVLANQLFSNSSWYAKVSEVSGAGMLPGFGGKGSKTF